jgi:glutamate-1-semialdehyde 2,1-aminomutase
MAAGLATLNILKEKPEIYEHINNIGEKLEKGLLEIAKEKNINIVVNRVGGMITVFFTDSVEVNTYDDVKTCDIERFKRYFLHMLKHGINLPQSQYEAVFLSSEHTEEHINKFLDAFRKFEG